MYYYVTLKDRRGFEYPITAIGDTEEAAITEAKRLLTRGLRARGIPQSIINLKGLRCKSCVVRD